MKYFNGPHLCISLKFFGNEYRVNQLFISQKNPNKFDKTTFHLCNSIKFIIFCEFHTMEVSLNSGQCAGGTFMYGIQKITRNVSQKSTLMKNFFVVQRSVLIYVLNDSLIIMASVHWCWWTLSVHWTPRNRKITILQIKRNRIMLISIESSIWSFLIQYSI